MAEFTSDNICLTLERIKDRRGDNDLYDYCADDPVNRIDRDGLAWLQVARIAGMQGARLARGAKNLWNSGRNVANNNPNAVAFAGDALEGAVLDGHPPSSPGGYTGWGVGKDVDSYKDGSLEDLWNKRKGIVPYLTKRAYKQLNESGSIE